MAKRTSKSIASKLHANPKKRSKPKKRALPPMDPSDPNYYSDLGERGGKKTLKNNGAAHFQYIARLSHESRRRNKIKRQNAARAARPAD